MSGPVRQAMRPSKLTYTDDIGLEPTKKVLEDY